MSVGLDLNVLPWAAEGKKMKKHYIFDLDGTLITSGEFIAKGVYDFFDSRGIAYPPDVVKIIMPMGYPGFARYAISLGAKGEVDELADKLCEDFKYYYANEIKLKPFAKEYLERLKGEGVHCHVLTGSPHELVDVCLKNNGVYGIFENIWSVDDFGMMKSNPELYKKVADTLGISISDIVFFDDNLGVIKTCRDIGLETVAVYDVTSEEYKDDIRAIADKYINSFEELL